MAARLYAGEWDEIAALGTRVLADDAQRSDVEYIHQQLGLLQVFRGELTAARASLDGVAPLEHSDDIEARHCFDTLAGLVAVAEADHARGLEVLSATAREGFESQGASSENARLAWPAAVDAALALGDLEAAGSLVELLTSRPAGMVAPILRAELERARGLLAAATGEQDAAEERLLSAVEAFEELGYPFWLARANGDLAEWLIAEGRGAEAAVRLRAATDSLGALRAEPELERARELTGRAITSEAR